MPSAQSVLVDLGVASIASTLIAPVVTIIDRYAVLKLSCHWEPRVEGPRRSEHADSESCADLSKLRHQAILYWTIPPFLLDRILASNGPETSSFHTIQAFAAGFWGVFCDLCHSQSPRFELCGEEWVAAIDAIFNDD